jgi:hypothetical protein
MIELVTTGVITLGSVLLLGYWLHSAGLLMRGQAAQLKGLIPSGTLEAASMVTEERPHE